MSTIELRSDLHTLIDSIKDQSLLSRVREVINQILSSEKVDCWDELSSEEKAAINEGLAQAKRGEGATHAQVMKEMRSKYRI